MVQTGAKSQLGGEKNGLFKVAYQVGIADMVKIEPRKPTRRQIKIANINFIILLIILMFYKKHNNDG